jgi:DNA-binding CsgD family transcriptional regulator
MSSDPSERRSVWLSLGLFVGIAVLIGADLVEDSTYGADVGHLSVEGGAVLMALIGVTALGRRALALARAKRELEQKTESLQGEAAALRDEADELRTKLSATSAEAERWRAEAKDLVKGLASAIDREFDRWGLSPAEREVGLLLLKGLSHQEIADVRGVSERTVRQQSRGLYKKAGLSGRADLSAYFLEDLLVLERDEK